MRITLNDIAMATRGHRAGADVEVDGVTIDSRSVAERQLFVPIVAERDGHDFVAAAVGSGAAAYLASADAADADAPFVRVEDTAQALMDLGRFARTRLPERVIGVTGSVGKTSTKDLLADVLRTSYITAANERSFNNELGLPLTLLNAPDDAEAIVVEMGARGASHIELLCSIAQPTVGVVTVVGGAHLELFGSLDGVAQAKGELIEALPSSGLAVLSADQDVVMAMSSRTSADVLTFGRSSSADVTAESVVLDDLLRPSCLLRTPWGSADLQLAVRGEHQLFNALAAVAAAGGVGVPLEAIVRGIADAEISGLRMQLDRTASGALVLNDAYNANPTSMSAGIDALLSLKATRRFAVLGVMAELGSDAVAAHREIAENAAASGIEVIAVDAPDYGRHASHVSDIDQALDRMGRLADGDAVLVKGSRVAALERIAERLLTADHPTT